MRKWIRVMLTIGLIFVLVVFMGFGIALIFGGPETPQPLESISDPFKDVDFSDITSKKIFAARDGTNLAYRDYQLNADPVRGTVVLIHGSSANSNSVHPLAKGFADSGFHVYALDMRGHGESGIEGQISYIGQLEDDVEDFLNAVEPKGPRILIGFSSGGGFTLRFAGSARQKMFDQYVLLAPFLHQDAPTNRPGNGGWVVIGLPRIIALAILNSFGVTRLNHLSVMLFAIRPEQQEYLTESYSYALSTNFRPELDYLSNIRNAKQPMRVLVGENDELFIADNYTDVFEEAGSNTPVTIVPNAGHIDLTIQTEAIEAIVSTIE